MLDAALRSGAHVVSTDFPEVGISARYGSDFVARLPEGGPARCNPVNARATARTTGSSGFKRRVWSLQSAFAVAADMRGGGDLRRRAG
jgi:calcium-dependent phosphoinositide phospholipase C